MNTALTTYYNTPASNWLEALPLGCGSRGAMVMGKYDEENILLNQDTVWSGLPILDRYPENRKYINTVREMIDNEKYVEAHRFVERYMTGSLINGYMPLGNMRIIFAHENISDYIRTLDLSNATYTCDYTSNGTKFHREGFVSHPNKVFAQKFTASNGKLNFTVTIDSPIKSESYIENEYLKLNGRTPIHSDYNDDSLIYDNSPDADCVKFQAWIHIETDGEKIFGEDSITVKDSTYAVIYQVSDTSFINWNTMPRKDPSIECEKLMNKVINDGYDKIKDCHIADYKSLFDRVELTLETGKNSSLPTNERIKAFADDTSDNELIALYYNFGRYLVISSEREDSLPANLQGIWSWEPVADWGSDFHTNINLQMNYWCVENANLSQCRKSLFNWLKWLSESGKQTARDVNNCRGSCAYHMCDIWAKSTPSVGNPMWAYWPMGEAWLAMDIFDHYEYTNDIEFLADNFDILKENTLFLYDWLYYDAELDSYITSPSTSPENTFFATDKDGNKTEVAVSKASTCDLSIIREVFSDFIKASEILGRDEDLAVSVAEKLDLLYPYQIGENGELLEWFKDFEQTEKGHRHMSHMLSVYPGSFINEYDTPELFKAVEESLKIRLDNGSGYTGWSCAWAMIFLAKFRNKSRICEYFKRLFRDSTSPNLFDLHPPRIFQIDGNFGATAAIGELFVQSNNDVIELFPCIPDFMKNGKFKGIRAKGGITVNGEFKNGELKYAEIIPDLDGRYKIRYKDKIINVDAKANEKTPVFS